MNTTDNPLLIFCIIVLGALLQLGLSTLKQHSKKIAYNILRPLVLIYWVVLGVAMVIGGVLLLNRGETLAGASGATLGFGLMFFGSGQTLQWSWLRMVGMAVLIAIPIIIGVNFILAVIPQLD